MSLKGKNLIGCDAGVWTRRRSVVQVEYHTDVGETDFDRGAEVRTPSFNSNVAFTVQPSAIVETCSECTRAVLGRVRWIWAPIHESQLIKIEPKSRYVWRSVIQSVGNSVSEAVHSWCVNLHGAHNQIAVCLLNSTDCQSWGGAFHASEALSFVISRRLQVIRTRMCLDDVGGLQGMWPNRTMIMGKVISPLRAVWNVIQPCSGPWRRRYSTPCSMEKVIHPVRPIGKVIESCLFHRLSDKPCPAHGKGDRVLSSP